MESCVMCDRPTVGLPHRKVRPYDADLLKRGFKVGDLIHQSCCDYGSGRNIAWIDINGGRHPMNKYDTKTKRAFR